MNYPKREYKILKTPAGLFYIRYGIWIRAFRCYSYLNLEDTGFNEVKNKEGFRIEFKTKDEAIIYIRENLVKKEVEDKVVCCINNEGEVINGK